MRFFEYKKFWFTGLTVAILLVFFLFRPLNSPQYRIIVADGLGYYAYLPAKFIYHDTNLDFTWFNAVFNKHYDNHVFEEPTGNFMVQYGHRMINLYYPGQSFLQLPFFFTAHYLAGLFNYPQDGFSEPYQLGMGLAAIFYTLLGLFFCSKLIFNISNSRRLSALVPLIIFFSTNLFTFSIFNGCYTHCYSFCFITLCFYFAHLFFNRPENKLFYFLMGLLMAVIVISLRPLNCILLTGVFYFFKPFSVKQVFSLEQNKFSLIAALTAIALVIVYNTNIIHTQTGSYLANTYTIGRFYFNSWNHVWDNFFGFQNGILWYTPIIFICFIPILFSFRDPKIIFLIAPLILIILLYSFWWYWNIVNRTLVDLSGILAILLGLLLMRLENNKRAYKVILVLSLLCVPFFQLKAYQLRTGILSNNYTYWRYYVKHFFTLRHVDVYPVNPKTVIDHEAYFYDFENEEGAQFTGKNKFAGKKAAILDQATEFACTKTFTLPAFFNEKGFKKIKCSCWFYRTDEINNIHLVFSFGRNDSVLVYNPFYINAGTPANRWDHKEFGMDLPESIKGNDKLTIYFWNPDKKNEAFIDDLKMEFIRTNGSDEITLEEN